METSEWGPDGGRSWERVGGKTSRIHTYKEGWQWVQGCKAKERKVVQEWHGTQAGEIIGLLDYLFAEHWELHCAQLRKLASEAGREQFASQLLAVNVQRAAPVPSYVPNYRPPAGRGRGFPAGGRARKELFKGGYDLTHYPNAKPEPTHCCRGWWLDGECNATAGMDGCKFQHAPAHRGQGMASTSAQPRL